MLPRKHHRINCCREPCHNSNLCQNLSYEPCQNICYSAGNRLAYDSCSGLPRSNEEEFDSVDTDKPRVNLCLNPWYGGECGERIRTLNQVCNINTCNKPNEECVMGPLYRFFVIKLVSNRLNQARNQDLGLINPWGAVFVSGILWVANNQTGLLTNYDAVGNKLSFNVNVIDRIGVQSRPTGLAENQTNGFVIGNGAISQPSFLLVATENGVISGFRPDINPNNTIKVIDRSAFGAVYTGLAMANNYLYATDFYNRIIDVFDSNFNKISGFNFIDGDTENPMPSTYSPFNIVDLNNLLYVAYAAQNPLNRSANLTGQGNGYVSIFTYGGVFVNRLVTRGYLNAPWGIVGAPKSIGFPLNTIFIGNNGDGMINVYDPNGIFLGKLTDMNGFVVQLSGLWSLIDRNSKSVYFTSGPGLQTDGLVGSLTK
jgi:uncharacterized protein (TIGR03118 family)